MDWSVVIRFFAAFLSPFLLFKNGHLLQILEKFLFVNEKADKTDVVIVLGGGGWERVRRGVELYKKGYADKILVSGRKHPLKEQVIYLGVHDKDIIQEIKSASTYENAVFSLQIIQTLGFQKAILVTSSYHSKRAALLFSNVFKHTHIDLIFCAIDEKYESAEDKLYRIVGEYLKILHFFIFGR